MMTNYDPSLYKEIKSYYEFLEEDEQFSKDLVELLTLNGSKSNRILQSTSREV